MSGRPRVLVTHPLLAPAPAILEEVCEVRTGAEGEAMPAAAAGCEGIVCQFRDRLDADVLATPGLRVVATVATGVDNVDLAAAADHRVVVANTAGVLEETVADLTFALVLAAARRLPEGDRLVRSGRWTGWALDQLLGQDVYGATLGLVGFGGIAKAVARRGRGFGMRVLYHQRRRLPANEDAEQGVGYRSLPDLLGEADVVSLHVPLTEATHHLIGAPELALMKPTAILVNTARGPVVDEAALATALAERRLFAAALDVYEREPAVPAKLRSLDSLVLSPHLGSASVGTRSRMCVAAVRNVLAVLGGERPPNAVNPEVLE
ncbi:MAG: D-glycerate dehydrogenase [Candidatus Dormiibacterota bacterium]